jgi:hypothetical protein
MLALLKLTVLPPQNFSDIEVTLLVPLLATVLGHPVHVPQPVVQSHQHCTVWSDGVHVSVICLSLRFFIPHSRYEIYILYYVSSLVQ